MKLVYAPRSPYARKCRIVAIERGIADRLELVTVDRNDPAAPLAALNPLDKVPALIRDDGRPLVDSPVICEYLDQLPGAPQLVPPAGEARWAALHLQAVADGVCDAVVMANTEAGRPEDKRSAGAEKHQLAKVERGLDQLERDAAGLSGPLDIGQIALACTLAYYEYRCGRGWRATRPRLAAWHDALAQRPSLRETLAPEMATQA